MARASPHTGITGTLPSSSEDVCRRLSCLLIIALQAAYDLGVEADLQGLLWKPAPPTSRLSLGSHWSPGPGTFHLLFHTHISPGALTVSIRVAGLPQFGWDFPFKTERPTSQGCPWSGTHRSFCARTEFKHKVMYYTGLVAATEIFYLRKLRFTQCTEILLEKMCPQ